MAVKWMKAEKTKEKEEKWANEMVSYIRDVFAEGDIQWSKDLFLIMNRESYEVLSFIWGSTIQQALLFSPQIYGMPIKVDPNVEPGHVRICRIETLGEFIPDNW